MLKDTTELHRFHTVRSSPTYALVHQQGCLNFKRRKIRCMAASHSFRSSTAAAKSSSRQHTVDRLRANDVFYFAFGSNMNPKVLTGRRMVQPHESLPCFVPDHKLSFGVQGLPYTEPGFATIVKLAQHHTAQQLQQQGAQHAPALPPQKLQHQTPAGLSAPCVHGVLHKITQREWERVKATEGVGNKGVGYQVITVDCQLYDGGSVIKAVTLQMAESSMHNATRVVLPSVRYLKLLQEGARHYKLDQQYQQWLATLQSYQPNSVQQTVGAVASGAVFLAATAPVVPAYVVGRAMGLVPGPEASRQDALLRRVQQRTASTGSSVNSSSSGGGNTSEQDSTDSSSGGLLPFVSWYMNQAQTWTWFVHDTALAPVLGSGCSNETQAVS